MARKPSRETICLRPTSSPTSRRLSKRSASSAERFLRRGTKWTCQLGASGSLRNGRRPRGSESHTCAADMWKLRAHVMYAAHCSLGRKPQTSQVVEGIEERPATDLRISAQAAPTCVTLATECSGPVLLKLWRKLGIATGRAEHTAMTCWSFASG